eukprot:6463310-Amphidinium_carterae.3
MLRHRWRGRIEDLVAVLKRHKTEGGSKFVIYDEFGGLQPAHIESHKWLIKDLLRLEARGTFSKKVVEEAMGVIAEEDPVLGVASRREKSLWVKTMAGRVRLMLRHVVQGCLRSRFQNQNPRWVHEYLAFVFPEPPKIDNNEEGLGVNADGIGEGIEARPLLACT